MEATKEPLRVKFRQWNCIIERLTYASDDTTVIQLRDDETFEPIAVATVCMHGYLHSGETQPKDEVYIKDYSENTGMVEALIDADIIHPMSTHSIPSGYVIIRRYKLTDFFLKYYNLT